MEAGCIINLVFVLALLLVSHGQSTDIGKTIILQENVSKSMDINLTTSHKDIETSIEIRCCNNHALYVCRENNDCNIKETKSNILTVTKSKDGILTVYFKNVARFTPIPINGTWHVCFHNVSGNTCNNALTRQVFIYAQLEYFNCTYDFPDVDHNLTISCTIMNIFPQAVCSFNREKVLPNIEYKHSEVPGNTVYFNSWCTVTLEINKESYLVKTTIYPNITEDIKDMTYGINITLSIKNVRKINSSGKCFVQGNSTSIHNCSCEQGPLENVTSDSNTETNFEFFLETPLNKENSRSVYCNRTTHLSERTTWSQDITELSSSQSTTSSIDMKDTTVSSQPHSDFDHTTQGTASLMTTSLTIISIIVFTLLTMILLYRFVSYPKHLMSVRITKSYMRLTKNNKGDEIDNTDIYHLFNKITCENDHYTTIEDLKKEKERQSSESFYTPSELTQNGDFHVLKNFRTAECSMKLEKNWDLDIYEKI